MGGRAEDAIITKASGDLRARHRFPFEREETNFNYSLVGLKLRERSELRLMRIV